MPAASAPEGTWRDFSGIGLLLTAVLAVLTLLAGSWSSLSFRQRRVAAVKERLKRTIKGAPLQQQQQQAQQQHAHQPAQPEPAMAAAETETLPLFERPDAMPVVAPIVSKAGLYMLCGPKGEGK
jgi:hypothetical protein